MPTKEDLAKILTERPFQDIQKKAEQNCLEPETQVNPQITPGEELKEIEELEKKESLNKSSGTPQKEQIEKQESEDDFDFGEFKAVEVLKENPEKKGLEQYEEDKKNVIESNEDEIEKYHAFKDETPIIDQEKLSNIQKNEPNEYFSESHHESTQHEPPINYDNSAKNEIQGMEENFFEESKHFEHNMAQQESFMKKKSNTSTPVKKNENEDLFGNFENKVSPNLNQDDDKFQIHENLQRNQTNEEKNEDFEQLKEKTPDPSSCINEESNEINAANKADEFAEMNDPHIPKNREMEKDAQINTHEKKVEFEPKNEDETEKSHNSPKEEVDEDEFGDFKINSNPEPHKIIEEAKETQDVSKAISNKNQENGGNDEDELDFGDFNINTVTNTGHENIQTTETQNELKGNDLFGKSEEPKADDLFGSENTQQPQAFNFSSNFGFSTNFSSSFSTNFGNFNFNQTTVEQQKELVIEKEKKEEIDDDIDDDIDDMFGDDKTNFKKAPESPLFGEEEKKTGLEENNTKKKKKTDFVNFPSFF